MEPQMDSTQVGSMIAPGLLAEETRKARQLYRQALLVHGGLLGVFVGALGLISFMLMPIGIFSIGTTEASVLLISLGVCAVAAALASVIFVPMAIPLEHSTHNINEGHDAVPMMRHIGDRLHARAVHAGSWSCVPAVLGFVLVVAGGTGTVYSAFLAVTLLSSILSFPRWSAWERAFAENVGVVLPKQ
jgi:hypothetical protein